MPGLKFDFRDANTGESLGSGSFSSPEEMNAYANQKFAGRKWEYKMQEPPMNAGGRFLFGATDALTGPAQLAYLAASAAKPRVVESGDMIAPPEGPLTRVPKNVAAGGQRLMDARGSVANALGVTDPDAPDPAISAGRAMGNLVYGPRSLAGLASSFGGEAGDLAANATGLGPLGRMAASVVGDVGTAQLTSAANRAAVKGAASGAAHIGSMRAYKKLRVLDMVPDGMGAAIRTAGTRAQRMADFEKQAWDKYDRALRAGLNRTGTGFNNVVTIDPTDLIKEASFIVSKTPKEMRGELPPIVLALAKRGERGGADAQFMTLTDLRAFHQQINELWRQASHPNASPFALGHATVADALRGPILDAYEKILSRSEEIRNIPTPKFATQLRPQGREAEEAFASKFTPPTQPKTLRPASQGTVEETQANALRVALEASRQTGSEFDKLRNIGIEFVSGTQIEPTKLMAALSGNKGALDSPSVARDFYEVVLRENPRDGRRIMSQAYQDFVLGQSGDFSLKEAMTRLNGSREIGRVWAGDEKLKNLEQIIKWTAEKKSPQHPWARSVLENALGIGGLAAVGAGSIASGGVGAAKAVAAYAAGRSIPRVWDYVRDNYGKEGVRLFARELLLDRDKYMKAERIAKAVPSPGDFKWVDVQMRALALRQSNTATQAAVNSQVFGEQQ